VLAWYKRNDGEATQEVALQFIEYESHVARCPFNAIELMLLYRWCCRRGFDRVLSEFMSSKRPNVSPRLLDGFYKSWYYTAPIHLAAANGRTEVVEALALAGAHVEAYDIKARTAFDIAAIRGHMATLQVCHSSLVQVGDTEEC
jgi:hypothetical protein